MTLQDHFRPPLSVHRHWHSFHNAWATYLSSQLNEKLPEGYFAESNVQFGIEIDVAAFEYQTALSPKPISSWTPVDPVESIPMSMMDSIVEIGIFSKRGGPTLAGAIELVSPANKDRPAHREAFISKCATYLQQGVGLIIVDVVTDRDADFHADLLARLAPSSFSIRIEDRLFAGAYRPIERDRQPQLDIWCEPLQLGQALPTLPLWLRGDLCLPVDLQAAYERTCREQRLLPIPA